MEHIPQTVHHWLGARVAAGGQEAASACALVEQQLAAGVAFMSSRDLMHFDAHFDNLLTDGEDLFIADFACNEVIDLLPDGVFERIGSHTRSRSDIHNEQIASLGEIERKRICRRGNFHLANEHAMQQAAALQAENRSADAGGVVRVTCEQW